MDRFTFNETDRGSKKEDIEWIRIWCENTNDSLLRVALIGDSITEQTYETVKKSCKALHWWIIWRRLTPFYLQRIKVW